MTDEALLGGDALAAEKARLRSELLARVRSMTASERAALSQRAAGLLAGSVPWLEARIVAAFYPLASEPDLTPLLFRPGGPVVIFPRAENGSLVFYQAGSAGDFVKGPLGVMEPDAGTIRIPVEEADLVLVPGAAFSADGRRLGRGGGFYDRALVSVPRRKIIGVCFPCQSASEIPAAPHDLSMGWLLDAVALRECGPRCEV